MFQYTRRPGKTLKLLQPKNMKRITL